MVNIMASFQPSLCQTSIKHSHW